MRLIKDILIEELARAATAAYPGAASVISGMVEAGYPPPYFDADYASSLPLRLAKTVKDKPAAIASKLIEKLNASEEIKRISSGIHEKNGFINFVIADRVLAEHLNEFLKRGADGFLAGTAPADERVLNEFISANPTGPLTMGNARGAFLGDVLSRVLRKAGYRVTNEYYVNNAKNSRQIQEIGRTYLGKSQSYLTPWLTTFMDEIKKRSSQPANERDAGFLLAHEIQKVNQRFITKRLDVSMDSWFEEEYLYRGNEVKETLELLKSKGLTKESEGALWMKTSEYGDDEDRVLVRSDGEATYFLTDIAYHLDKFRRGYTTLIDIWGADHQGHVKRLHAALKALGKDPEKVDIIITQLVRLVENGETAKMSKRAGMYVTLEELVNEVGVDVARFFFLMRSADAHIDFDLGLAKERSDKNPVFYVQYGYVRARNILRRALRRLQFAWSLSLDTTWNSDERMLVMHILRIPELITDIAATHHVHQLTGFASELARLFHLFYEKCPVLREKDKEVRRRRLILVKATRRAFEEVLDLMGITKLQKM